MDQFLILLERRNQKVTALSAASRNDWKSCVLLFDLKLIFIDEPLIGLSPNLVKKVF
jgi:ABC-type branched-subunit amino acid transport system ATPase component